MARFSNWGLCMQIVPVKELLVYTTSAFEVVLALVAFLPNVVFRGFTCLNLPKMKDSLL